ncbi:hypothetical protein FHS51_001748 [Sphingobium wenxiniae]|uniref:Uncharacterized protein n=1 Tax=Sphingobium wenxiniae (strain DSM 21828 / CGMCC 1.7748 / JZ-1) TaxID=595605 RepID=A0A562KCP6_SPHWJ|nr:hypothetical protein [Sphingobium wenxiniae]MBB6191521.1 hypothetical protein [Sphingobium wenxiniae]TWH93190.1 hypothetical protein IQ35_02097 [Sphingobium wenxiniae]
MFAIVAFFILKAALLLVVMAAGGLFAAYGVALRIFMGMEARRSTIRRYGWLCWVLVAMGAIIFAYASAALIRLILA